MPHAARFTLALAAALCLMPQRSPAQQQGLGAAAQSGAQPVDECQVIARVDGDVILAGEVLWQVNLLLEEAAGRFPPEKKDELREQLMARQLMPLLDERMAYADFRRTMGAKIDMEAIHDDLDGRFEENEIPRLIKMLGVEDQRGLEARLAELGTSLHARREAYYRTAIAQFWLRQSVEINEQVTHQELLDYYYAHQEDYEFPAQVKWEELMVSYARCGSREEAWRRLGQMGNQAWKLAVRTNNPAQPVFAEIAKAKSHGFTASEGGVHDWTTKGALADAILNEALWTQQPGEMGPIVETDRGCHIVRVLERKEAGRTPFTKVQREIREKILNARMEEAFQGKLADMRATTRFWTVFTGPLDRSQNAQTAARAGAELQ